MFDASYDIFIDLAEKWKTDTALSSSSDDIILNVFYQRIIALGPNAIPFILEDLKVNGGHWFSALEIISGENPVSVKDVGNIKRMTEAWLTWGRMSGYLD